MSGVSAVILAAGLGTRMRSRLPKVLHPVGGRPMVGHVVEHCRQAGVDRVIVVVGAGREQVQAYLGDSVAYAVQEEQLGTAHALLQAEPLLDGARGDLLVLYGDTPLLRPEVVKRLLEAHRESGASATVLTAHVQDPGSFGRVIRGPDGTLARIVEFKDATPEERAVREINAGVYCFRLEGFFQHLRRVPRGPQGEFYLPDVLPLLMAAGGRVEAVAAAEEEDVLAPNDRRQLAQAEAILRRRVLDRLMESGVTVVDPATTWVSAEAEVGPDTVLLPFTFLEGRTRVGRDCVIGPGSRVVDSTIGDRSRVEFSVVESSRIAEDVRIGPYAHVRPGCEIGPGVELGNYAEVKKARLGPRVKMHHHGYLGDVEVGEAANIGAGVITSNYDGVNKFRTVIGPGAFVGTNVNLVAPLTVGEGAYVAAGSTVNQDVPPGALAIARARQENKEGYAARIRARARVRKEPG
ncbi:bifunctional UDP-N-acetylglucosamine diphosphorylase/glucosamine-1-phosphate N-acetyltransferase GlmU [Caldinitratiruptor microaerophilus]|uniref:Bifunctional protein GlmU n=1 Tax=Caldinitratiruptor microaerophilus TaxID=671077 RepID=A0AA35CME7_9FIRM|nr:bifunctional UDP-N-acetylglucosamine diphosphorylase/glucosamine-1-phosphate N-acetyltransferase GlmU [Caldinitratiruptor microaerophilus]BDG62009.1 bifunctional protein GlmU [Caldinitratiruptor microaerophilus]